MFWRWRWRLRLIVGGCLSIGSFVALKTLAVERDIATWSCVVLVLAGLVILGPLDPTVMWRWRFGWISDRAEATSLLCPACGRAVSHRRSTCPLCGARMSG